MSRGSSPTPTIVQLEGGRFIVNLKSGPEKKPCLQVFNIKLYCKSMDGTFFYVIFPAGRQNTSFIPRMDAPELEINIFDSFNISVKHGNGIMLPLVTCLSHYHNK